MRLTRSVAAMVFAVAGCAESEVVPTFSVTFTTESDPGVLLAGVEVFAGGRSIGVSGAEGIVQTVVRGPDGSSMPITYTCPEGYVAPEAPVALHLQPLERLDPEHDVGLTMRLPCRPSKRRAVLVVRTNDPTDLPVVVDGQELGRTGPRGVAHIALTGDPGTEYRVRIDTSAHEALRPENPVRTFALHDADEVFVFDQTFESSAPAPVVAPRAHHRSPSTMRTPATGPTPAPFVDDI